MIKIKTNDLMPTSYFAIKLDILPAQLLDLLDRESYLFKRNFEKDSAYIINTKGTSIGGKQSTYRGEICWPLTSETENILLAIKEKYITELNKTLIEDSDYMKAIFDEFKQLNPPEKGKTGLKYYGPLECNIDIAKYYANKIGYNVVKYKKNDHCIIWIGIGKIDNIISLLSIDKHSDFIKTLKEIGYLIPSFNKKGFFIKKPSSKYSLDKLKILQVKEGLDLDIFSYTYNGNKYLWVGKADTKKRREIIADEQARFEELEENYRAVHELDYLDRDDIISDPDLLEWYDGQLSIPD